MSELLKYHPAFTREYIRAIVKHDADKLAELREFIRFSHGEIGNADFVDIEIREAETLLCNRHRLNVNKEHWDLSAEMLDRSHTWDADGVWFPLKEA